MEFKKSAKPATAPKTGLPLRVTQAPKAIAALPQAALHRDLQQHTARPSRLQRQVAQPVLQAAHLHTQEVQRLAVQRQAVQGEAERFPLSASQVEAALQRQQVSPPAIPVKPQGVGDWVTVMRARAEEIQGQRLSPREAAQYTSLQRQVAQTIASSFRADRQPPEARHQEYAGHLATLQRSSGSAPVASVALGLLPTGERLAVQRALDETLQREAKQQAQDAQALHLHSLQRQLADLDHEATQPVFERIQARRGAGNPLPAAIQRHLEQGLNYDLSAVRIHDDAEADKLAKGVNATAFTTGTDIYFQSGKFSPNTQTGLELLAHEATHTVQQSKGQVGRGIDPDAGLETQARTMGARLAQTRPRPRAGISRTPRGTLHALRVTGGLQRLQAPQTRGATGQPQLGVIKHTDGAVLHTQPKADSPRVTPQPLVPGKKVSVLTQTADGWSKVATPGGQVGYVQTLRVTTDLPDAGAQLIRVTGGTTAIGVAERYYKSLVKPGQDLRYYVNVLKQINEQRGTQAFQGDQVKAGAMLWIPGPAYAASLVGVVGSGSITGGAMAKAKGAIGNSPGANILRSVLESPQYIKEVLGEAWETVKAHWPVILATTTALIGAELLVGALAAAPEPTTITKFLAVGLQGLITAVAGAGALASVAAAGIEGHKWLTTAWTAQGNAGKIHAASKAFLQMIGNVVMAVASAAGVKASYSKTSSLTGLFTKEKLITQIGNKGTYESLMGTLRNRGVTRNNAQLLGELLKKVPDPLELKGFLRKVDKPVEFLETLHKYPLNRIRNVLAEFDSRSISPEYASKLLKLNLENPVPARPLNPARAAILKDEFGAEAKDKTFGGKGAVLRKELSPAALAKDELAGKQYQALLDEMLEKSPYVYRYTTRAGLKRVLDKHWDIKDAYMTNAQISHPNDVSLGAQLKPAWYSDTQGNPDVVLRIPRALLTKAVVPRPAGNTPQLAGWEFTTSAYPEAGKGGFLQFMGSVPNSVLEDGLKSGAIQEIPLSGGTTRLSTKGSIK